MTEAIRNVAKDTATGGFPISTRLGSLANLGQPDLAVWLTAKALKCTIRASGYYWSSTTHDYHDNGALQLAHAEMDTLEMEDKCELLWPVRAGQQDYPDPAYPANVWKTGQDTELSSWR